MAGVYLSPGQAASAADTVYDIKNSADIQGQFLDSEIVDHFDLGASASRFSARSGAFFLKSKSGFGILANGKGKFKGHAIIACRGTGSLYDGLTDLNTGLQRSKTGHMVHAGFNRTFNDFAADIKSFLNTHRPDVVHCVGHSLGGALATLSADCVVSHGAKAALYTFGSPRVGFEGFARGLSLHEKLGAENIFRVFHSADPVSMVPLWPFVHVPQPKGECFIGKSFVSNPWQHPMNKYIDSVGDVTAWHDLRKPQPTWESHVDEWLNSGNASKNFGLNLYNLSMFGKSLALIFKEILGVAITTLGVGMIGAATILDQLSMLLDKAATVSKQAGELVMSLMRRVMGMLGMVIQKGQNLTLAFIRYVLNKLMLAVNTSVNLALQLTRITR